MIDIKNNLEKFVVKMSEENLSESVISTFKYYYEKLIVDGENGGMISESKISPVKTLADLENLSNEYYKIGDEELSKTVLIKLNGGLGTSMGLNKAKSLIKVKGELSFLDIIAKQAEFEKIPLILMNSYHTEFDSIQLLKKYELHKKQDLPLGFYQNKIPKISKNNFSVAVNSADPELEWCPPGHGDIYSALVTSGLLNQMIDNGYEYAFISNSDNLGAVLDKKLLGYFIKNKFSFLMEAADRTESDKKGGHLAQSHNGKLLLREIAQCPDNDINSFQNIKLHKYFNTNNIWINLIELKKNMKMNGNNLKLPMICNKKTINPKDKNSEEVYQLETAMGSAINIFDNSSAIRVPRTRFIPIKTTNDLIKIKSDLFELTKNFRIQSIYPEIVKKLIVNLDPKYYKMIDDFEERFNNVEILMSKCKSLEIIGNIKFSGKIDFLDDVKIIGS